VDVQNPAAERLYTQRLGEDRQYIGQRIAIFTAALNSQDERLIREAAQEMQEFLQHMDDDFLTENAAFLNRCEKNHAALEAVRPKDLEIGEISVELGTPWLKPQLVLDFIKTTLTIPNMEKARYFDSETEANICEDVQKQ